MQRLVAAAVLALALTSTVSAMPVGYDARPPWERSTEGVYCPAGIASYADGDAITVGAMDYWAGDKAAGASGLPTDGNPLNTYTGGGLTHVTMTAEANWFLNTPTGLAYKRDGRTILIADTANNCIRSAKAMGHNFMKTAAGSPAGTAGDLDGQGTNTLFRGPSYVAVHPTELFALVTDTGNHNIRRIDLTLESRVEVSTLVGTGAAGQVDSADGAASFDTPMAIAIDAQGEYAYVTDGSTNYHIRKLTMWGSVSTLTAGAARAAPMGGIAVFPMGTYALFTEDTHGIFMINTDDGTVTEFAGKTATSGAVDAIGTLASFNVPKGLDIHRSGKFALVADSGNHKLRSLDISDPNSIVVTTIAGSGTSTFAAGTGVSRGAPITHALNTPTDVAFSPEGLDAGLVAQGHHVVHRLDLCPKKAEAICADGYYMTKPGVYDSGTMVWPNTNDGTTDWEKHVFPRCETCREECEMYFNYETTPCTSATNRVCTPLAYVVKYSVEVIKHVATFSDVDRANILTSIQAVVTDEIQSQVYSIRESSREKWTWSVITFALYFDTEAKALAAQTELQTALGDLNTQLVANAFADPVTEWKAAWIEFNGFECRNTHYRWGHVLKDHEGDLADENYTPVRNTKTCGSCLFASDYDTKVYYTHNNKTANSTRDMSTFALNRTAADCSADCLGILDLSYPKMDFLDVKKGVFDNLPGVTHLSLSGTGIIGVLDGAFDGLHPNAVIDLRCTNITCAPNVPEGMTLLLPETVMPWDKCNKLTIGPNCTWCSGCDFFTNEAGLLSRGGECRNTCQELDLRDKGIKMLPRWPNAVFDAIHSLRLLHLDAALEPILRPTKHFAIDNTKQRILHIHLWPADSWVIAGYHWFRQSLPEYFPLTEATGNN
mmetsp:Transcript_38479/g.75157  ORF Transcript_38479/g.75157 Transcript_38479/m.75157 type:complete len:888 (+) Transcript_38479:114-2777(+)|eukprot:CAMPEP_0173387784 /NCGR_PEP_ID=MMETSP1356-20130122/10229_1 /TAXON_ID=77927 ORGANISM="Hemiselmis virescens, Strain PCC157" /NCGR_SAMPLE_ID=MMETSP1356 /ASSEMBLY_ACC=CAM_ASM_000847 /LENGTH=887 /DNA_ID=CAMNT_0014344499 /DNA_START=62 /DNA_END=2725 /DNA_ORIENTATION=+